MPQAPKCKVCGANHFGGAHVWARVPAGKAVEVMPGELRSVVDSAGALAPVTVDPRDAEIAALRARVAQLEARLGPPKTADRAAYMREWRAKQREAQR